MDNFDRAASASGEPQFPMIGISRRHNFQPLEIFARDLFRGDVARNRKVNTMKMKIVLVTMIAIGASLAATAATLSHGQIVPDARNQKAAPAPTCCYIKAVAKHLPAGGVSVQLKQACVAGCDMPCIANSR
jgi:hypothetical protein